MIPENLNEILKTIKTYDRSIKLIAVSKTVSNESIENLYKLGVVNFAENYVHELQTKAVELAHLDIKWHFIGQIQSNKIKSIAQYSDYVHSLCNESHIIKLNHYAKLLDRRIQILIQINPKPNHNKNGMYDISEINNLLEVANNQSNLNLIGLMMVSSDTDEITTRKEFNIISEMQQNFVLKYPKLNDISTGMSNDYKIALDCGSTMLRIGSLLFGKRV